tara:strand:+ start:1878 stop:2168 length:291 start_codon:yes stop_codon:yes gene_type:complete
MLAGNQSIGYLSCVAASDARNNQPKNKMKATTSALYAAANEAFDKTEAAKAEAFRAAVHGTPAEAAKALTSYNAAKALEKDALRKADAAADLDLAA